MITLPHLPAYLSQLALMRSRRSRIQGTITAKSTFPETAFVLCLAISVNWLPCVAVETEIEVLSQ